MTASQTLTDPSRLAAASREPSGLYAMRRDKSLEAGQREDFLSRGRVPDAHGSARTRGQALAVGAERSRWRTRSRCQARFARAAS